MKQTFRKLSYHLVMLTIFFFLASCFSAPSGPFNKIAKILDDYKHEEYFMKEKEKDLRSYDEEKAFRVDYRKMIESYTSKLEKASTELNDYQLDIIDTEDFKVVEPVKIHFERVTSDMSPLFQISGKVVAARDIEVENKSRFDTRIVYLIGVDKETDQMYWFSKVIGEIPVKDNDTEPVITAGTPIKFYSLIFKPFYSDEIIGVKDFKFTLEDPGFTM